MSDNEKKAQPSPTNRQHDGSANDAQAQSLVKDEVLNATRSADQTSAMASDALQSNSAHDAVTKAGRIETSMLSMPTEADPMVERAPLPNTAVLSLGWRIQFKIGDKQKTLPITSKITIGRVVENDNTRREINFDLTPFGAYPFGISRTHAVMTLKDGYLYLEDLGSTNGTRINGFQLTANQKYRLRDGDEVEFARLRTMIFFKGPDIP